MKFFKSKIWCFVAVLLIILTGDFLSARYGTGVVFKRYSELSFDFEVVLRDGEICIFNPEGEVYLITEQHYFPSGRKSGPSSFKDNEVFIEDVLAFSVSDCSLFVLGKGIDGLNSSGNEIIIKIKSVYPKEGFLKYYEFVEEANLKNIEWQELDRSIFLALQLNWRNKFWLLSVLNVVLFYFLFRKNVKK